MDKPRVDVVIPTKNRYEFIALVLQSLTNQTYTEWDLIIIDDSEKPVDMNTVPFIAPFLKWMDNNGHNWRVLFGRKQGPHKCHQLSLETSRNNYLLRIDDDCVMTDTYIEELVKTMTTQEHCAAVGGLILDPVTPNIKQYIPENWKEIKDFSGNLWEEEGGKPTHSPALQWFVHREKDIKLVQHIHSSFLYKKAAALAVGGWEEMNLSKVGMTEETWFTYKLYVRGWNMYINPSAIAWHLKAPQGGTRTDADKEDISKYYFDDRVKFENWYRETKKEIMKGSA